ncbi:hypothetical protein LTR85_007369 [Meristemomyces frigidus]|nr:hypothetical protein LTR85_007369 [Meristemomyces frigidus]
MAANTRQADVVVGVDFGMTCTGVAYSMGPEWTDPKTIQRWPGKLGHEVRNKVETSVSYDLQSGKLGSWGFLCDPDDDGYEYNSLFKLNLDPGHEDATGDAPSTAEAQHWYSDYLSCLYSYIMKFFKESTPRFFSKKVDPTSFVFSVPVTWRNNPAMLHEMERLIYAAGFGSREQDTASIYLTEAEAAAIYASKQSMSRGEVFLVVDAGGGTTDLNVLKIESAAKNSFELVPLCWTEGAVIGSTLIDYKIRVLVKKRLGMISGLVQGDIDATTTQMMQDRFETFKCSFGSPGMDVPKLFLPIPGIGPGLNLPHAGVEDSKIVVTRAELQAVFDDQIEKMCNLIDRQLRLVRERHPGETISYFVLSGGLGSSPYVQSRIRARYENAGDALPGAEGLQVLVAGEPQLAVLHGLVTARTQSNRGGPDIYAWRCCPVSYGILCREHYDPHKHQGETVVQDPYDKKRWAERQINWVIKQGQVVRADTGISERYRYKIEMGREGEPWKTHIVMSTLPAAQLPSSLRREGVREVCSVETVLHTTDLRRKNHRWYHLRKEYNVADFEVRMLVGTGLRFEIWSPDGIRSREHGEIEVQWEPADDQMPSSHGAPPASEIYRLPADSKMALSTIAAPAASPTYRR